MRCIPCKPLNIDHGADQSDQYQNELQRKELELRQKEKELIKKDKILQRKISKYNKKKDDKAKADLRAAAKLRDARRMLLLTIDTRENTQKSKSKSGKKKHKTKRDAKQKYTFEEKFPRCTLANYCNDFLNRQQCECSRRGSKKRPVSKPDSILKCLFRRPCSCKNYTNLLNKSIFRPCRRDQESGPKQSSWEKAAGDCYLMSLRRPPQLWIYHRWPQFYPQCIDIKQQCKRNCGHLMLCLAGILFWTPCLLCLELCKCCFCACCTDNYN